MLFLFTAYHDDTRLLFYPARPCHFRAEETLHQYVLDLSQTNTRSYWLSDPAGLPALPSQSQAVTAAADAGLAIDDIQGDIL